MLLFLRNELVPVDSFEKSMLFDGVGVDQPPRRIFLEQLEEQVVCLFAQMATAQDRLFIQNIFFEDVRVHGEERRVTDEHLVEEAAEGPPVARSTVAIGLGRLSQDLRCTVFFSSNQTERTSAIEHVSLGATEID